MRSRTTTALTPAGMIEAGPVGQETYEVGSIRIGDLPNMNPTMLITEGRRPNMTLVHTRTHTRTRQITIQGTIQVPDRWLSRSPPPLVLFLTTGLSITGDHSGRKSLTGTGIGTEIGIGSPIQ